MTLITRVGALSVVMGLGAACGGSPPPEPELAPPAAEPAEEPPQAASEPAKDREAAEPAEQPSGEPTFTPGMTVEEAKAAARHHEFRMMEQEVLAAPLMNPELYEPCGLSAHKHFSVKLAVWNGKVVGMDLETKPVNEAYGECLKTQFLGLSWDDRVRALNTVEYSF